MRHSLQSPRVESPARSVSGHSRWLLWSSLAAGLAGCAAEDVSEPPDAPSECDRLYRVDSVRIPDEVDSRAAAILAAVFRTYEERDLAAAWADHLDDRLATTVDWTIRSERCGTPDTVPLGALADVAGLGGADAGWHPIARVSLRVWPGDGDLTARLDGELEAGYPPVIADAFLPFLDALLAADATSWGGSIDAAGDGDGRIDRDELLADGLFQILIRPDRGDRLSFGFELHAVDETPW